MVLHEINTKIILIARGWDLRFEKTDRNYFSPLLYSEVSLNECHLVLDYRYFHSVTKAEINKMRKLCCLRKSFVDEIQSKLANHVSRLGLLYLP